MPKKDYPSREQRMKDLTRQLEQGIREVFDSGKYTEYLAAMSRFHHYSARNVLLIQMQLPNATRVASAKKWREEFGRHINRGEKAIYIIAPAPIVRKVERQKIDPDTKAPMLDENGHVIMEEKEFQVPLFRPVPVFDVSQTDGKPLPQLAENLSGDVRQYEVFMEALRRTAPVPITFEPMAANMDGYFSADGQRIAIREGMSQVQTVSAAVHEITHSILHGQKDEKSRSTEELEAESVSYVVCQYYGIETGANSLGYHRSSDPRYRSGRWSRHLGCHQPAGRLRQRQPRCEKPGHETADGRRGRRHRWHGPRTAAVRPVHRLIVPR